MQEWGCMAHVSRRKRCFCLLVHPCCPVALSSCWERVIASVSRQRRLALLRPVPIQSCSRCELQFLFEAKHLGAVHTLLFLQLPLLPQFQDAHLLPRFRGPPDKPLQVVAHCSHHKGHGEGDIRGIGPYRRPNYRPHDCSPLWLPGALPLALWDRKSVV